MSYLANSENTTGAHVAADFNCGWSVVNMLAELSLQSGPEAKPRRAPRRAAKLRIAEQAATAGADATQTL